jgi:RecB family exonuclease
MRQNGVQRKGAGMSATMVLNKCARQTILQQEHDYPEHPKSYHARWRGTGFHSVLEDIGDVPDHVVQEIRFFKTVKVDGEDVELSGQADYIDLKRKLIIDYKTTDSLNVIPIKNGIAKDGHEAQVNIYRWLTSGGVRKDTDEVVHFEIERAGILYVSMKGTKKIGVKVWDMEETEQFIIERLRPLVQYRSTGELPPLLMDERSPRKRSYLCNYCPVREICDERYEHETSQG